ncbi:methyltransferase family protein [Candidatus Pyrohabitans sp.]
MGIYAGIGISTVIWAILGAYVFSEIKKTYERGVTLPKKLLSLWYIMWGFHHLPVILASLHSLWPIPLSSTAALACGLVAVLVGLLIMIAGIAALSWRRSTGQDISGLVTTGIYSYSRNPQFVGWFLILLGISLAGRSGLALVLTGVFAVVIHLYATRLEEPYLERLYGEEYRLYKSRVARYIGIPKGA